MKKWIAIILTLVLFITTLPAAVPVAHAQEANETDQEVAGDGGWVFRRSWGGEGDSFLRPSGIAIGDDGRIYVSNTGMSRILIISEDDTIKTFGYPGYGGQAIESPEGLAFGKDQTLYVVNSAEASIMRYDKEGNFIQKWGSRGYEPGKFYTPKDVAVDSEGFVYVTDFSLKLVQKFTFDGTLVHHWGTYGTEPGQFHGTMGIAIDAHDNVYVADMYNHRIQKFDKNGDFLLTWGKEGNQAEDEFSYPKSITINSQGHIVVSDGLSIRAYTPEGNFIRYISQSAPSPLIHESTRLQALACDIDDNLYVANFVEGGVDKYDKQDEYLRSWGYNFRDDGKFVGPNSMATDINGRILVADSNNDRIQVFSKDGTHILTFGESGTEDGQLTYPRALAVNSTGDIHVVTNSRIQVYSKDFAYKFSMRIDDSNDWKNLADVAIDKYDNVYCIEVKRPDILIHKFSSSGELIKSWTSPEENWNYFYITIIDEEIYHLTSFVKVFDLDGNLLRTFEVGGRVYFYYMLASDSLGRLYTTQMYPDSVIAFDKNGDVLFQFGRTGSGPGDFNRLSDLIHHNGEIYITDKENHRIQVFSLGTPPPDGYSGLAQNGSFEATPELSEWITGGNFPVALSNNASHRQKALVLGHIAPGRTPQEQGKAFAYSNFYVDPNWTRPVLSFDYNMFANDVKAWSDFFVEVQDGVGLNHLATVLHDGFEPCIPGAAPNPGQNLGWRSVEFDLSAFKGQHIRLKFSVQNRWPNAWGMWTHVDNVRVLDYGAAPLPPGPFNISLPLVSTYHCDPIGKGEVVIRELPFVD